VEDVTIKGLNKAAFKLMSSQLKKDMAALAEYKSDKVESPKISILAQWLPREGTHFDKKLSFVKRFVAVMWPEMSTVSTTTDDWKSSAKSNYRKMVSELTATLELPKVVLSAKREDEINFGKVASKASFLLTKTFLNERKDGEQRSKDPKRLRMTEMFIDQLVNNGLKGSQLMPHEIVRKILSTSKISRSEELVLDA
jgi:hypothetical protein